MQVDLNSVDWLAVVCDDLISGGIDVCMATLLSPLRVKRRCVVDVGLRGGVWLMWGKRDEWYMYMYIHVEEAVNEGRHHPHHTHHPHHPHVTPEPHTSHPFTTPLYHTLSLSLTHCSHYVAMKGKEIKLCCEGGRKF